MLTLRDVLDRLKDKDEIDLLELLNITSVELVDRFEDKVEELYENEDDGLHEAVYDEIYQAFDRSE